MFALVLITKGQKPLTIRLCRLCDSSLPTGKTLYFFYKRLKTQLLQKLDEWLRIWTPNNSWFPGNLDRCIEFKLNETSALPRSISVQRNVLLTLFPFDLIATRENFFKRPELLQKARCNLGTNTRDARHIIDRITHKR